MAVDRLMAFHTGASSALAPNPARLSKWLIAGSSSAITSLHQSCTSITGGHLYGLDLSPARRFNDWWHNYWYDRGSGPDMRLVERFTRVDADTLRYEYTNADSASYAQPWSVRVDMRRSDSPLFEYACHEGNYGMENLLVSARAPRAVR